MDLKLYAVLSGVGSGRNLVKNWRFEDWAVATLPDGWVQHGTQDPGNTYLEESPADSLHLVSDGAAMGVRQDLSLTTGVTYNYEVIVSACPDPAGQLRNYGATTTIATISAAGTFTGIFVADDEGISFVRAGGTVNITITSIRIWQ